MAEDSTLYRSSCMVKSVDGLVPGLIAGQQIRNKRRDTYLSFVAKR